MDSIAHFYREINSGFLNKSCEQGFEISYLAEYDDNDLPLFRKFAHYTPENHEKIKKMMDGDDCMEFFIHETDLIRYYKDFKIKTLSDAMKNGESPKKVLKAAYLLNEQILKEYFENIGSSRILRTLEDLNSIIQDCLAQGKLEFIDVFLITRKDDHSYTHCTNTGIYCMALANKLKMKPEAVREIGLGGMLFSIGKKSIPYDVIIKQEELSPEEFQLIRKLPSATKKILNDMKCYSENIMKMAAEHREKFDGTGYPFQMKGEKISLYARVVSIMDVFGALTAARPNRKAFTPFTAVNEMKNNMTGHFDTRILINFIKILADAAAAKVAPKKTDTATA
ncbi:MAG: HD-GYP domain-containing protein (c-di-GMP phosphodiesterase class II) [Nitrospinales bacterium]|jgi:HD-GYP domain-containing protein (c-di-GMP phosphodiesterase class II)